jgi:hypothetical protein
MGFLQICAGVVLLQLSKSAKDVPDTAVFKGDLDQVRTVAEQEEPEYEPRADTIRGGGSILRSLSKARTEKEAMEVKRLHEEQMQPIGENEQLEWDGLRRRKTVISMDEPERTGTVVRRKSVHPPLGMSHFPTDDSDDENSYHPGFFQRLRSRGKSTNSAPSPALGLASIAPNTDGPSDYNSDKRPHTHDTSYRPHEGHIQFARLPPEHHERQDSRDSLRPPKPPPHTAKRQFSFQNVFFRHRGDSTGESSEAKRPTSRNSRKNSKEKATSATEEERMGLVKGDSQILLPIPSRDSRDSGDLDPPGYSDWKPPPRLTESPSHDSDVSPTRSGIKRVDTDVSAHDWEKDQDPEKRGGNGNRGAFL